LIPCTWLNQTPVAKIIGDSNKMQSQLRDFRTRSFVTALQYRHEHGDFIGVKRQPQPPSHSMSTDELGTD
jgi:hypothetical protein